MGAALRAQRCLAAAAAALLLVGRVRSAATLLGTESGGGSGGSGTAGLGSEGSTAAVDLTDTTMTRIHGSGLKLDVLLFELLGLGGVFRLSPTHWEFQSGPGKWAGTTTHSTQTLYLNDKQLLQLVVAEDAVTVLLPRGKIIAKELALDGWLGGQMRVDICSARAALSPSLTSAECESHRDSQQALTVQQSFDAISAVLADVAKLAASAAAPATASAAASAGGAGSQGPGPAARTDEARVQELVRQTFAQELQPTLGRDTTQKVDAARDELRKEVAARLDQQATQARRAQEELEGLIARGRAALEEVAKDVAAVKSQQPAAAAAAAPSPAPVADPALSARAEEKAERNAVSIAVLQSQLDKSETAKAALEETVAALRERVSRLEGLVEFALKARA